MKEKELWSRREGVRAVVKMKLEIVERWHREKPNSRIDCEGK